MVKVFQLKLYLIKLLNIDHDVMPVIYEKNGSMKLTTKPGSKIKILSDDLWIKVKMIEIIIWHSIS